MRHLGAFLLGTGVGSGGVHWNGQIWRFLPSDFLTKSHNQQRYGKKAVTDYDLTVQDWGITYEELEPLLRSIRQAVRHERQSGKSARARSSPAAIPSRARARTNTQRRR